MKKDKLVKETDLEIGNIYYLEPMKESYGTFKGFVDNNIPTFEPIINANGFCKNSETGLIEFYSVPSYNWIEKQ